VSTTLASISLHATDWWTIATAAVCGVACGVPGVYLVLRRMSMLGDAISHAVLPGLAAAFLITQSRDVVPMLVGALATGVLTAGLAAGVARVGKVPEDAALGVVFSTLFALGVVLISFASLRNVDLDAGCVLYGLLEMVAFDTRSILGVAIPRAFIVLASMALLNIAIVAVFFKELKLVAFDQGLAATLGFRPGIVHAVMLGIVAATCVGSFEAVGSIVVVAMLIVPGATAYLLTDRLGWMFVIASVVAIVAAFAGHLLALRVNGSSAGAISTVLGIVFLGGVLFSPRHGVLARWARHASLVRRIRREDVLAALFRAAEPGGTPYRAPARGLRTTIALAQLRSRGLITPGDSPVLTAKGQAAAREIIRAHRLWETYLSDQLGLPTDHLHDPAHRVEHFISESMQRELAAQVGRETDPQGRPIPEVPKGETR